MPSRFERYRFTKHTVLSEKTFNDVLLDIDLRLAALEDIKKDWEGAIAEVSKYGLVRIDFLLRDAIDHIEMKKTELNNLLQTAQNLEQLIAQLENTINTLLQNYSTQLQALLNQATEAPLLYSFLFGGE